MIDKRLLASSVVRNAALSTVDFVDKGGGLVFRTCSHERSRVVAQIGTASSVYALQAALLLAPHVAAVDVNMGCPVHFSTSGGMGSALLSKPEAARDILVTLRRCLPPELPVTAKIRLLPTRAATLEFAKMVESCGVAALAVHGRYVSQKPRDAAHWAEIAAVSAAVSCPVIANGDVFSYSDFAAVRRATGAASAMAARGAQWNASIFRAAGLLPAAEVRRDYAAACVAWDNPVSNSKYCLREMLIADVGLTGAEGASLAAAKTLADVAAMYGLNASGHDRQRADSASPGEGARAHASEGENAGEGEGRASKRACVA